MEKDPNYLFLVEYLAQFTGDLPTMKECEAIGVARTESVSFLAVVQCVFFVKFSLDLPCSDCLGTHFQRQEAQCLRLFRAA